MKKTRRRRRRSRRRRRRRSKNRHKNCTFVCDKLFLDFDGWMLDRLDESLKQVEQLKESLKESKEREGWKSPWTASSPHWLFPPAQLKKDLKKSEEVKAWAMDVVQTWIEFQKSCSLTDRWRAFKDCCLLRSLTILWIGKAWPDFQVDQNEWKIVPKIETDMPCLNSLYLKFADLTQVSGSLSDVSVEASQGNTRVEVFGVFFLNEPFQRLHEWPHFLFSAHCSVLWARCRELRDHLKNLFDKVGQRWDFAMRVM